MIYLFTAIGFPPGGSGWVDLYKNRRETAHREEQYKNDTESQNTQNRIQK